MTAKGRPEFDSIGDEIRPAASAPDRQAIAEDRYFHRRRRNANATDHEQRVRNRALYTHRLYWLMIIWMIAVLAIVLLTGFFGQGSLFYLADSVLITLISGTTANIIGLFLVVAKYLFPRPNS